jgi:hypothetical protein
MMLKGFALSERIDGVTKIQQVYQAGLYWDSPLMHSKNRFNFTVAHASNPRLRLMCKDDYNRRGGALGNVWCEMTGRIKDKPLELPQPSIIDYQTDEKEVDSSSEDTQQLEGKRDRFMELMAYLSSWSTIFGLLLIMFLGHLATSLLKKTKDDQSMEQSSCNHSSQQSGTRGNPSPAREVERLQRPANLSSVNNISLAQSVEINESTTSNP